MGVTSFEQLYVHELQDLYSAESQLIEALPKIAAAANSGELKSAVELHLQQTKEQLRRLEEIFTDLGESPKGHECKAMKGLIEEGDEMLKEMKDGTVRDAAIIAAAQRVEHYEIAGYGTARTYADMLGYDNHAELLQKTLNEEGQTDENLTMLAVKTVNPDAIEKAKPKEMAGTKSR